jgi:hypothetical protein
MAPISRIKAVFRSAESLFQPADIAPGYRLSFAANL